MSAQPFDPDAIAAAVFARQAAARPPPAPYVPLGHGDGPVRTGCGSDATHLDLPVHNPDPVDLFDRLAAAEERRRIRSPFGDHAGTVGNPRNDDLIRTQVANPDPDRFASPELNDDLWDVTQFAPAEDNEMAEPRNKTASPTVKLQCPDGACGLLLTGGGAPRGWVLVRVIGAGPPRRYCSPACASRAILTPTVEKPVPSMTNIIPPTRTRPPMSDHEQAARSAAGKARNAKVDYVAHDVREWARTNGIDCPTRGRYLPKAVVEAWRARGVAS